ncbi:hypothetical protein ACDH67_12730 [Acinetobacter baumannii]
MFNEDEEKLAHENWYKNNDPIAYKFYRDLSPEFETDFYTSEIAWLARAKAQAVPEGYKLVPVELSENIAERLAFERVPKPRPENDPVWVEIAERAYKSNLLAKKWELVREYKILTEASASGAEG